MKRALWPLAVLVLGFLPAGAAADREAFRIETEITGPAGQDWGRPSITTLLDVDAEMVFDRDGYGMRLAFRVGKGNETGCHPVNMTFTRTKTEADGRPTKKEMKAQLLACDGKPVDFDGKQMGAASMRILVSKVRR